MAGSSGGLELKAQLDTIGEAAAKYGFRHFAMGDLRIVFARETHQGPVIPIGAPPTRPLTSAEGGMPTEDELLFASSPFPLTEDELNARPPHG